MKKTDMLSILWQYQQVTPEPKSVEAGWLVMGLACWLVMLTSKLIFCLANYS